MNLGHFDDFLILHLWGKGGRGGQRNEVGGGGGGGGEEERGAVFSFQGKTTRTAVFGFRTEKCCSRHQFPVFAVRIDFLSIAVAAIDFIWCQSIEFTSAFHRYTMKLPQASSDFLWINYQTIGAIKMPKCWPCGVISGSLKTVLIWH